MAGIPGVWSTFSPDGAWGSSEVLVASGGGDNNSYSVFSPDSQLIAYVNATQKSTHAPSAVVRLVRVADGTIVDLPRLNERVGESNGESNRVTDVGNSMPTGRHRRERACSGALTRACARPTRR